MNTKQTIAIIGKPVNEVYTICKNLSRGNYRLVLSGDDDYMLKALASDLAYGSTAGEVETQGCIIDASWEADFIIMAEASHRAGQIAEAIREVANQKIVIISNVTATHCGEEAIPVVKRHEELQQLLPNS
ncbi:MAG TPA: hypothetical protein VM935_01150, partial [Chitinophagaceae bacterium]|nr:hypothetical protein [Chitinophagaceae bacterium]